jgi:hypothetical protein
VNLRAGRRGLLLAGASALACAALPRARAATQDLLPQPRSLAAEVEAALAKGRALVVLASLEGCSWCKLVRQSYLAPLLAAGQPVVEFGMGRSTPLADFAGAPSTQAQMAKSLQVRVAPTVLFMGRGGHELAPRLVGVPLPDFYGAYLQQRLDAANRTAG